MSALDNTSFTVRTLTSTVGTLTANDSILIAPFGGTTILLPATIPGRVCAIIGLVPLGTGLISADPINGSSGYTVNTRVTLVNTGSAWFTLNSQ